MFQVGSHRSVHQFAVCLCAEVYESFQQRVIGVDVRAYHTVVHRSLRRYSVEVVIAVVEFVYCGGSVELRSWRHDVCSCTFHVCLAGKRSQSHSWQEVLQLQVVCLHHSIVAHALNVYSTVNLHASPTFCCYEVCPVAAAVDAYITFHSYAVRYAYAVHRHEGCHEVHILRPCLHIDVSKQLVHIIYVGGNTVGFYCEGCRQRGVQTGDIYMFHVSCHHRLHRHRLVGIFAFELLGQVTEEQHDVLLAYLSVGFQVHLPGVLVVEGVHIHHKVRVKIRVWSPQTHCRQVYLCAVQTHRTCQFADLYAALLLEC